MTLSDLADKVERLTGPCRETDALIWWLTSRKAAERVYWNAATGMPKPLGGDALPAGLGKLAVEMNAPKFTESLDAAMMLEVEKWWLTLDRFLMSDDPTRRSLYEKTWRVFLKRTVGDLQGDAPIYQQKLLATGPTPAIALTAGWLRARDASEKIPHGKVKLTERARD